MQDLTCRPMTGQLVGMALPMAAGMIVQTLYFFVDLYFVARLGDAAIAGASGGYSHAADDREPRVAQE